MIRRWGRLAIIVSALVQGGCPPPPVVVSARPEAAVECPDPPAAMSSIEEIREISRAVRELRANLMAPLEGPRASLPIWGGLDGRPPRRSESAGAPPSSAPTEADEADAIYATLHPPELALSEAALAQPSPARKLDPAWLRGHLLTARVELRSRAPLPGLDGELRRARLVDGKGREHEALELEVRKDSQGLAYLIQFPASAFDPGGTEDRLRFTLRLALDDGERSARWTVPRQTLETLDELPLVYYLARLRTLRWARWLALVGQLGEARRQASEIRACAPELALAGELERALAERPAARPAAERVRVDLTALARLDHLGVVAELGHAPARDLARRAALLSLVEERAGARGLAPAAELGAARGALREAALALERGALGWGLSAALHRFDRQLSRILAHALDPLAIPRPGAIQPALALEGIPSPGERELELELARRVAQANAGLVPVWVASPRDPDPETIAAAPRFRRAERRPVLELRGEGGLSLCELDQRLGWGWTGLGVPPRSYRTRFEDRGAAYWRAELADKRTLAALRPGAERLLQLAALGPEEGSVIALDGLAQLKGAAVRPLLLSLIQDPRSPRHLAAGAARALGRIPGQETAAALALAVRSPHPALRAAALEALGARGLAEERGMLRAGLQDSDPGAAVAALTALLRSGDAEGIAQARRWLADDRRGQALRAIARARAFSPAIPRAWAPLATSLLALLGKEDVGRELLAPAVALLEGRALPALLRIYERDPSLRRALLELPEVSGSRFEKLLRRAAADPSPELRRLALPRLALLKAPPHAELEEALKDGDRGVRLAAHVALARLGRTDSLLALGEGARGSCEERALTLTPLAEAMEPASRAKLLRDALATPCQDLHLLAWQLLGRFHAKDAGLLRTALSHPRRELRVRAALLTLGLPAQAAIGQTP